MTPAQEIRELKERDAREMEAELGPGWQARNRRSLALGEKAEDLAVWIAESACANDFGVAARLCREAAEALLATARKFDSLAAERAAAR